MQKKITSALSIPILFRMMYLPHASSLSLLRSCVCKFLVLKHFTDLKYHLSHATDSHWKITKVILLPQVV